jgi:hypothetical protein
LIKFLLILMGAIWLILLLGQWLEWGLERRVIRELPSPDGRIAAYLVESRANRSSPLFHSVRLDAPGAGPSNARSILQMEGGEAIEMAWTGPQELTVTAPCRRFSEAANHFADPGHDLLATVRFRFPPGCPVIAGAG